MHGLTGGSWKRHTDRTRATEMKDTRGNLAVTSGSETYRRCALPRQLSTLLRRRCGAHPTDPSRSPTLTNVTVPFVALGWGVSRNPTEHDLGTDQWVMVRDARRFDVGGLISY